MATSLLQDNQHLTWVLNNCRTTAGAGPLGTLNYAGNYWPHGPRRTVMNNAINSSFIEVQKLVTQGFLAARSAISGLNDDHVAVMTKWFGPDPGRGGTDYWTGVKHILGELQIRLCEPINLYYRGQTTNAGQPVGNWIPMLGQPNDYPNGVGALTAENLRALAEAEELGRDGVVGLCSDFFERTNKGAMAVQNKGRDSVAGIIVHELSHNFCGTQDHYYGGDCQTHAAAFQRRVWYNADNIEYFCEDIAAGGDAATETKAPVATGAAEDVADQRDAVAQLLANRDPKAKQKTEKMIARGGPKTEKRGLFARVFKPGKGKK